jgi:photosystem II stability/assembly factor-like uncharacterized protein
MYQRMYPFNEIPENARREAFEESRRQSGLQPQGAGTTWMPIGPRPTTSAYQANGGFNSGRINAIAVSPANVQLVLIGSATGGIWRSVNGGTSFTPVSDSQADLGVAAIAFAPSDPTVVYAAMGDLDNSGYFGTGILKSTDSGATWTRINNTSYPSKGNSVAIQVDPLDADRVYAAQYNSLNAATGGTFGSGIYVSTDGGVAWTRTLSGLASDVVIHPTNRQIVYAGMTFVFGTGELPGLYKSVDAGLTWTRVYDSPYTANSTSTRDFRVAVSPQSPNRVYIYFGTTSTSPFQVRLERSDDAGATWTDNGVVANNSTGIDSGQFGYNTYLAVSPTNSNNVYVGARDVFRSTDAGATFTNLNNSFAAPYPNGPYTPRSQKFHADQQSFAFQPGNGNIFYCGNDGGVWKTTNFGNTFTSLNSSLSLTQFIGIAVNPDDSTKSYGGAQDNGSQRRTIGSGWTEFSGGDGGKAVVNPLVPTMIFSSYIRGSITRWLNNGTRYSGKIADRSVLGEPATGARIAFYPPIVGNGVDSKIYIGTRRLLRCDDCDDTSKWIDNNGTAPTWTAPGGTFDQTRGGTDTLSAIAVARSNNQIIYTGSRDGRAMVSTDGGESWNDITAGLPNRSIRSISVNATNPAVVYLTVSGYGTGHVFASTDGGSNWTDISNNLPNIPTSAFLIDPLVPTTLYAGTDIGVFRSTDGGSSWLPFNTGLPPVPIMEFTAQPNGLIHVATYGRGAYELAPANVPTVNVANATAGERGTAGNRPGGEDSIDFEISLTETSTEPVTVIVSTNSLTAVEGEDFSPVEDLAVVFPPNTLMRTVSIPLIEDPGDEPDETFALEVTGLNNAVVGDAEGIGTIVDDDMPPATLRTVRPANITAEPGDQVIVSYQIESQGNERSMSFTANFDPSIFSSPVAALGDGTPAGATLNTNVTQVENGRLGFLLVGASDFAAGSRQVMTVRFNVATSAPAGPASLSFGTVPNSLFVVDGDGVSLPVAFQPGSVQIGATGGDVEISGRVVSPDEERGIRNAVVTLIGPGGFRRTATTSSFGTYRFDEVPRAASYTLTATSKRYRFSARVIVANDSLNDVDFVGLE